MSPDKLTVKTKLAFGVGATGEGATNWIFAGLTFFFYNQVLGLSGSLTGLAVLIAIIFDAISDDFLCAIEEQIEEGYKGKHGMTDQQYMDGRSPAGKQISGDSKGSGANYSYRAKNTGPNKPGMKPQGQARMNNKDRSDLAFRKLALKKASNN